MLRGSSVACKGTGKSLGLTNGSKNFGIHSGDAYYSSGILFADTGWFDKNTTASGSAIATGNSGNTSILGITTDKTKSGIITDVSGLPTLNWAIKF